MSCDYWVAHIILNTDILHRFRIIFFDDIFHSIVYDSRYIEINISTAFDVALLKNRCIYSISTVVGF